MAEKPKPDPNTELHRTLNTTPAGNGVRGKFACATCRSRRLNCWIAEALIDHHRVIEKIRADIPAGELSLLRGEAARLGVPPKQDIESFNDQPVARGVGDTTIDAIKTMWPLQWRAPKGG